MRGQRICPPRIDIAEGWKSYCLDLPHSVRVADQLVAKVDSLDDSLPEVRTTKLNGAGFVRAFKLSTATEGKRSKRRPPLMSLHGESMSFTTVAAMVWFLLWVTYLNK